MQFLLCSTVIGLIAFSALADEVPDLAKTPGVARSELSMTVICATKWGKDVRHVTPAMRSEVLRRYGLSTCVGELDHLISRELGGADTPDNLWCQAPWDGGYSARAKDRLENRLHREMCAGRLTLKSARKMLVNDWRRAYLKYFGGPNLNGAH